MRLFTRFLLCFALIGLAAALDFPRRFGSAYPMPLSPRFDDNIRQVYKEEQDALKANTVLLGNSTLKDGVELTWFESRFGEKVHLINPVGSSTSRWYAILKNNLIRAAHKPKVLVIFYRSTELTNPEYNITGRYFELLDEYASPKDSEIIDLAYIRPLNPLERIAGQYFPLYGLRENLRDKIDNQLRNSLPAALLKCDRNCVESAQNKTFSGEQVQDGAIEANVTNMAQYRKLNFAARVNHSFLPLIIQLARENQIRLVFVCMPTVPPSPLNAPILFSDYSARLKVYLNEQGVESLDFTGDPRLPPAYFSDAIHMNRRGKQAFTPIIAESLRKLLETPEQP